MAEIGNLSVQLSLDSAQFDRSVASMNRTLQAMGQEIRGLQNKGKDWGASIDGLKQKQEAYTRLLEGQETKVRKLAAAYEEAKNKYGENSTEAEKMAAQLNKANAEMQRTQTELSQISAELKRQEDALRQSQSAWNRLGETLTAAGDKLKSIGDKMTSVGKELSMKITAPLAGLAAAATKVGSDFEAGMSKVAAISGATGEDLVLLEAKARELGATTQFSATEASEALSYMAMAGWKTNDMLAGIGGVMNLAAASGENLALVSDIVTDALTAFGMSADDTGKFVDVLAAASSNSNTNVAMLGESFKHAAPVVGALKMSAEDAALALGLMANAGIKGSNSGTALRTMLTNLASPTKEMGKEMSNLGISLTNSDGSMKSLREVLDNLRSSFDGLTPAQQASAAATIFGKEAMSGALSIINASEADYQKLASAIDGSAGAAEKMAAVMNDNLQGRLKEMKSALEEAAISVYQALQPALESAVVLVQKLADYFNSLSSEAQLSILAFAGIAAAIGPVLVVIGTLISSVGTIVSTVGAASTAIAAMGGVTGVLGTALAALTGPIGIAVAAIAGITTAVVTAYNKVDWFRDGVDKAWASIKTFTVNAFNAIKSTITTYTKDAVDFAKGILDKFKAFWDENGKAITSLVKNHFGAVKTNIESVMKIIQGVFEIVWPIISNVTKIAWETIKMTIKTALDLILGIAQTMLKLLEGDWKGAWESIKQTTKNIADNIVTMLKNVDLVQVGKDIINGLIKGITSMTGAVIDAITGVVDGVVNTAKNLLQIKSPSRVMHKIGEWTVEGFVNGMKSMENAPAGVMDKAIKHITDKTKSLTDALSKVYAEAELKIRIWGGDYLDMAKRLQLSQSKDLLNLAEKYRDEDLAGNVKYWYEKTQIDAYYEKEINKQMEAYNKVREGYMKDHAEQITTYETLIHNDTFNALKEYLDKAKKAKEISAIDEMRIWRDATTLFKEDSIERKNAVEELKDAHVRALSEIEAKSKQLAEQEAAITAEYTKAVNDRAQSIAKFAGVFDEFKINTEKTGEGLMANLQSQVDGFRSWQESITALSSKAIDEGLLAELKALGPRAAGELAALNAMTDAELEAYSKLYQEKQALAREQAEAELVGMKEDTEKRIDELRASVQRELDEVNNVWKSSSQLIVSETDKELAKLKSVGQQAGQGLLDGLMSKKDAIVSAAQSIADAVSSTIQSALDIHSPSRVMRGFGVNIGQGLVLGMDDMISKVAGASSRLSNAVANAQSSLSYSALQSQGFSSRTISQTSNIDNRKSFAPVVNVYTTESPAKVMQRELRRMAFQF